MTLMLALNYIREITIAALTIAVIALIGLYGQSRADIEHLKTEHALQLTTAKAAYEVQARKLEQQQYDQTITAINDHKKREAANASAIASANTANERLSQTIDRLAANAETDASYRAQYAATT